MIPLGEPAFYSGWNHAKTISFSLIIARSLVVGKKTTSLASHWTGGYSYGAGQTNWLVVHEI
jgi:hypothetical protein